MAMSSGMSSSMAAVLLVVASLVAGTCAFDDTEAGFNITLNHCNQQGPIVISSPKAHFNHTLAPGGSVHVNDSGFYFFLSPFTFTFATRPVRPIVMPKKELDKLRLLRIKNTEARLKEIEIKCDGNTNCFNLYQTYTDKKHPLVTRDLGRFCGYFYGAPGQ